jgi:hypothetical protein
VSYLRFTPEEFWAVRQACRPLDLGEGSFPAFQSLLVKSLAGAWPDLARRLADLPARGLRILFEYLRDRRPSPAGGEGPPRDEWAGGLTFKEWQAVRQASSPFFLRHGSLPLFQAFLVCTMRETTPGLADKLARLSRPQIDRLYHEVRKRCWGGA